MFKILSLLLIIYAALSSAAFAAAPTTITESNISFSDKTVIVKQGGSLSFANKDDVTHNLQIVNEDGTIEDKGLQKPGETITEIFNAPGTYNIHCAIHPKMKMTVTVE